MHSPEAKRPKNDEQLVINTNGEGGLAFGAPVPQNRQSDASMRSNSTVNFKKSQSVLPEHISDHVKALL